MKKYAAVEFVSGYTGTNDNNKDPFFLRNEFINWLKEEEEYTQGSANSYASYVSAANKNVFKGIGIGGAFFQKVEDAINTGNKANMEALMDPLISLVTDKAEKPVRDKYKNGLLQYRYFLLEKLAENDLVEEETPEQAPLFEQKILTGLNVTGNLERLVYDKDTLKKIFFNRMISQDRCYGNVFFPIRFLKKLFYKSAGSRNYLDEYIDGQINNIELHTSGATLKLGAITALTIETKGAEDGEVIIVSNGGNRVLLYTKAGVGNNISAMHTVALRHIAIDHIFPMKLILEQNEQHLPVLKQITEAYKSSKKWKSKGGIKNKTIQLISNELLNGDVFNSTHIPALKKELEFINSYIRLQLMDARENLVKKAKFN